MEVRIEQDDERGPAEAGPEWFERLWKESHARIYNLAARIVGDRDAAADITQEVFLRAYARPPDEKGIRDPQPWLYRVAVNACYDHLRRRAARPTAPLEDAGELAAAGDGFVAAETAQAVETTLGALSPRYRTALVLRDLHGLDTDEVASVMGVSGGTARVLLHRSRSAFKKKFRELAPAGSAVPAAGLAAFLPTLAVPAALQAPPLIAGIVPAAPVALSALPAAAAPAAGLMAKLGGAVGVKVAAVLGTAAVVTGGAVAAHELTPAAPERAAGTRPAVTSSQTGRPEIPAWLTGGGTPSPGAAGAGGAGAQRGAAGAGLGQGSGSGSGQTTMGAGGSGQGSGGSGAGSGAGSGSGTGSGSGSAGGGTGSGSGGGTSGTGSGGTGSGSGGGTSGTGSGGGTGSAN